MSDSLPTVSVIIPAYNCAKYIAQTLDGIYSQAIDRIEVIVVDDGSTDATCEVISTRYPQVSLLRQKNSGVCVARNAGIRAARGEFICVLDHDDYWLPGKLKQQLALFAADPELGVAYSDFIRWFEDGQGVFPDPASFPAGADGSATDDEDSGWIYHRLLLDCWVLTSSALFRRCVFDDCGLFDPSLPYSEDWDLWLRIARKYRFAKLGWPTTLYRQHPQQGNRVIRPVDYRTRLLEQAVARWGLCSPDGRCLNRRTFKRQLGAYHASFALGHLKAGSLGMSVSSFLKAWRADPVRLKYLAYVPAAVLGWRPRW